MRTWQTWEVPEHYDPGRIADDLADCRQRGLDWLDRRTTNQAPVSATALQRLAEDYVTARQIVAAGRIAQIKTLLRDGIEEMSQQGDRADATLLHDLFFGDSPHGTIKPPGDLLKAARAKAGDPTDARFRERRTNVMRSFAQFLILFASPAVHSSADKQQDHLPGSFAEGFITVIPRHQVFISYSHADRRWLKELQTHLMPYLRSTMMTVWDDSQIRAGEMWKESIEKALASAKVAVLLVSPAFLASRFIAESELPPLLDAAKNEGVTILWVPVRFSSYARTPIAGYQAAHSPEKPLASLSAAARDKALVRICEIIQQAYQLAF